MYRIGDLVMIVGNNSGHEFPIGAVVRIKNVSPINSS